MVRDFLIYRFQVMTNLLAKDVMGHLDVKLFVIPDCLKAISNTGPGKLVSQLGDTGVSSFSRNSFNQLFRNSSESSPCAILSRTSWEKYNL